MNRTIYVKAAMYLGVVLALGAGRARIIRQFLAESLALATPACAVGLLLALYALHLYTQFGPEGLIRGTQPSINLWVMAFSILVSIGATAVFGLAPAFQMSRVDLAAI